MRTVRTVLVLLSAAALTGSAFSADDVLTALPEVASGDATEDVVAGDWNRDGSPDLATVNRDGGTVSIFVNPIAGVFVRTQTINCGVRPFQIIAGDFNNDGTTDLAVAVEGSDQVAILRGTGLGNFNDPAFFGIAGDSPRDLAAGDFDGADGLDIATADRESDTVSILLNNGDGTFSAGTALDLNAGDALRAQPSAVAVGDLNHDGLPDIVVAKSFNNNNEVAVFLGLGGGAFGSATTFPTQAGGTPWALAVGDLNGDGTLDLAVANQVGDSVSVLLGAGDGTFGAAATFDVGNGPEDLIIGDLNGDGKADIITANREADTVSALLGDGTGLFALSSAVTTGGAPVGVAVGDFDGDGKLDVATANEEGDSISIVTRGVDIPNEIPANCAPGGCGPAGTGSLLLTLCGIAGMRSSFRRRR